MPTPPASERSRRLARLKAQRAARAKRREDMFDSLVTGVSHEFLARKYDISARTVRRELDRALDQRPLEAPHRYVRLQVERLNCALRIIDDALSDGEVQAVDHLLKVIDKLDRYHLGAPAPAIVPPRLERAAPPLALPASGHQTAPKPL